MKNGKIKIEITIMISRLQTTSAPLEARMDTEIPSPISDSERWVRELMARGRAGKNK